MCGARFIGLVTTRPPNFPLTQLREHTCQQSGQADFERQPGRPEVFEPVGLAGLA
jgi:hypothetical protein